MRLHFSIGCFLTIVGLHDFVKVSISAEFKSFLLIMRIDAPESTTNSRSSGSRVDAGRHLFSEGEKNVALFFSLNFRTLFGQPPRCFTGTEETNPQNLEHWGYADEVLLSISVRTKDFGLECPCDVQRLSRILHIGSISECLSSSVKSMKTSTAPYPGIRNPFVVFLMGDHIQRVSPFYNVAHASSTQPLHFCHQAFWFAWLFINLAMRTRALYTPLSDMSNKHSGGCHFSKNELVQVPLR